MEKYRFEDNMEKCRKQFYGEMVEKKIDNLRIVKDHRSRTKGKREEEVGYEMRDKKSYFDGDDEKRINGSQGGISKKYDSKYGTNMTTPLFRGTSNLNEYLDWEERMKNIFENQYYSEAIKVRRACSACTDYARTWWDKLLVIRRNCGDGAIVTWGELKRVMRKYFVPNHYDTKVDRSDGRDSYEEFFVFTRRSKLEYQGTSKFSNVCTFDIICVWCLEIGYDIHHCPKEDVVVEEKKVDIFVEPISEFEYVVRVDAEIVEKVETENDFPLMNVECVELFAVEGESLDGKELHHEKDEMHDVHVEDYVNFEEDVNVINALVESCASDELVEELVKEQSTSSNETCDEILEQQVIHIVQMISKDDLEEQLKFQNMSEKKCEMVKRKSDKNSEMAIEIIKETKEKYAKEKEKNELMAQKSEDEKLTLYEPLKVLLYKEVLSHCHDIAGSIPSIGDFYLQEFGVMAWKQSICNVERVNIFDPFGSNDTQGKKQDLRTNLFEEGEYDMILNQAPKNTRESLELPIGSITRGMSKRFKEAMQGLVERTWKMETCLDGLRNHITSLEDPNNDGFNVIQVLEGQEGSSKGADAHPHKQERAIALPGRTRRAAAPSKVLEGQEGSSKGADAHPHKQERAITRPGRSCALPAAWPGQAALHAQPRAFLRAAARLQQHF